MPIVKVDEIDIAYEQFGEGDAPVILLIMGLGSQLHLWPEAFCQRLVNNNFRVIRFDNRDVGLSSKLDHLGSPNLVMLQAMSLAGLAQNAPYSLKEMSDDAAGLLKRLGVNDAHIVGASMGGMIAQEMAIHHKNLVMSMTCLMSSSGDPSLPGARADILARLLCGPASTGKQALIEHRVKLWQSTGSPGYPTPVEDLRHRVTAEIDRCYHPEGFKRQLAAIICRESKLTALDQMDVPTLVVHGDADPLIPLACGQDLARRIPRARMEVIAGMGHDLPDGLVDKLARLIVDHAKSAKNY